MSTYTVKQGDSTVSLSERHGLFAHSIWDHPANQKLATRRSNMNELLPGDEIFIPELQTKRHKVAAGKFHKFRRKGIPAKLVLQIAYLGIPRAEQEYVLEVQGQTIEGVTDDRGVLEAFVPPQAREGVVVIGPDRFELTVRFGHQDPHDEFSGIQGRLRNLGYLTEDPSGTLDPPTRAAIVDFETRHGLTTTGKPSAEMIDVLSDYHGGRQSFPSKAILPSPWPTKLGTQKAVMSVSLSASAEGESSSSGGPSSSAAPSTSTTPPSPAAPSRPPTPSPCGGVPSISDTRPPRIHYVIIGRGATAWYNHLTMLLDPWGLDRLTPELPVLHLGYAEPWGRRGNQRMGQWPRMLDFFRGLAEGLELQGVPDPEDPGDWLESNEFANALARVEAHILAQYAVVVGPDGLPHFNPNALRAAPLIFQDGVASTIHTQGQAGYQEPGHQLPASEVHRWHAASAAGHAPQGDGSIWHNDQAPYRISVFHQGHHQFIYAAKIDVCTGPGRPRSFRNNFFPGDLPLYQAHLPPFDTPPARYDLGAPIPRIVNGNDYIGAQDNPLARVLVFKGNPVGAQSVQSALDMPTMANSVARVWWIVNKSLHGEPPAPGIPGLGNDADVPGKRNLLEQVGDDQIDPDEQLAILTHHPNGEDWVDLHFRQDALGNQLKRIGFHEIANFHDNPADGGIFVDLTLHPRGDPNRNIPGYAPAAAQQSLDRAVGFPVPPNEVDLVWTADDPPPLRHAQRIAVDRVVYSLGQDRGRRTEGTAAYLVQRLGLMHVVPIQGFPAYITDGNVDTDVGNTGHVRVLGSAFLDGPGLLGGAQQALRIDHAQHGATMPREAPAGGGGLNLAITNIRRANVCAAGPTRLNFATADEMVEAGLSLAAADWIVVQRSQTDRGFSVGQYATRLAAQAVGPDNEEIFGDAPLAVLADAELLAANLGNIFVF